MATAGQSDPTSKQEALVRVAPDADFSATEISVQEGFVLSRVDGKSTVKTLCLLSGMGEESTRDILRSLWKKGLIVIGNRKAVIHGSALTEATKEPKDETPPPVDVIDVVLERHREEFPTEDELDQEDVNIPLPARLRMHAIHKLLDDVDLYQLLGLDPTSDLKEIRRAYFRRSKEFHPDRYFNRRTGPYKEKLLLIFSRVSHAYRMLENVDRREGYMLRVSQIQTRLEDPWHGKVMESPAPDPSEKTPWRVVKKKKQEVQERQAGAEMDQTTDGSTYRYVRRPRQGHKHDSTSGDKSGDKDEHHPGSVKPAAPPLPKPPLSSRELEAASPDSSEHGFHLVGEPPPSGGYSLDDATPIPEKREPDPMQELDAQPLAQVHDESSGGQIKNILLDMSVDSGRTPVNRPVGPRLSYERGRRFLKAGDLRGALASLRTALSFEPNNVEYRKTYNGAVAQARDSSAEAYFQRGQLEQAAGHLEVAYGLFGKAASLEPRVQFLLKAAQVAQQIGDLLAAQVYAKRAVEKQPYSKDARLMMAKILLAAERDDEARQELETVLKAAPEHAEAKDLLEQIARSGTLKR